PRMRDEARSDEMTYIPIPQRLQTCGPQLAGASHQTRARGPMCASTCSEDRSMRTKRRLLLGLIALAMGTVPWPAAAQDETPSIRLLGAGRAGDQAAVTKALADGASPNARNRLGETVLLSAIKSGRLELARQMIAAGTDVNLAATNGVTPLMAAAHGGYTE